MADYRSHTDVELTNLLKSGDQAAFTGIYERYKGLLYIYACKIVKDDDIAEDLVQEIFIYLWDKRQTINFNSSISSYLYSAVRYKFFDLVDHQKVRADYVQAFQEFLDQGEYVTDNYILEKELSALIEKEIANLPAKMREVFLLSRKENLSNQEIAERLDISEKTVKNQLSASLKLLRTKLGLFTFLYLLLHY
jgi:RNA polymerase sigma-70 factor (family 1)